MERPLKVAAQLNKVAVIASCLQASLLSIRLLGNQLIDVHLGEDISLRNDVSVR